jgi:hypothetical protein
LVSDDRRVEKCEGGIAGSKFIDECGVEGETGAIFRRENVTVSLSEVVAIHVSTPPEAATRSR